MSSTKIEWTSKFKNIKKPTINFKNPISNKEKDGNTENKTVIHKSLLNFYIKNQNSQFPQWLIENDEKHNVNIPSDSFNGNNFNENNFNGNSSTMNSNRLSTATINRKQNRMSYERTQTPASASLQSLYTKNSSSTMSSASTNQGQFQNTHYSQQSSGQSTTTSYSTSSLQLKEKFMGQKNRQSFQLDSYSYNTRTVETPPANKLRASWAQFKK